MYIRNHGQATAFAEVPQSTAMTSVKSDDSGIEALRVQIVVEYKLHNTPAVFTLPAKQEGPALPATTAASLSQAGQKAPPEKPRAREFMPRCIQPANSLDN